MFRFQTIDGVYEYVHDERHNYTHRGLAFGVLEDLIIGKEKGIRLKHPIQIIADFLYEQSEYLSDEAMAELLMKTSDKLIKYYSEKELSELNGALIIAIHDDGINEKYIEVVQ